MNAKTTKPRGGRHHFLLGTLGIGGALVVGWGVMPPRSRVNDPDIFPKHNGEIALNGRIRITSEGDVVLAMPRVETDRGIHTALSVLAAEELDVPLSRVHTESAPVERIYGNVITMGDSSLSLRPDSADKTWARALHWITARSMREVELIITGGSSSTTDSWQPVRKAATTARAALV